MAETMTKTIPMAAFGKARPRVTRNGTFMPKGYESKKRALRWQFGPVPDGLVRLSVTAVRRMPKNWSKNKRAAMHGKYAKPKPDLDNIFGGVMDALFEDDDRVVAFGPSGKVWGDSHEMIISIEQVDGLDREGVA